MNTELNTESKEHLSSLMDGEVSQETGRFLVRRLSADGNLRDTWARYHLIRDCLRNQDGQIVQAKLSNRVNRTLSEDAAPVVPRRKQSSKWFKPVAGFAVAASVALMAIITVNDRNQPDLVPPVANPLPSLASDSFTSPNIAAGTLKSTPVNLSGTSPQENHRMNAYFLRHYQVTGDAGGRGFVPFVPIVVTQAAVEAGQGDKSDEKEDAANPQ